MAKTFKQNKDGNIEVFENGRRISTTTPENARKSFGFTGDTQHPPNLTPEQQARYTELVGAGAPQDVALNAVKQITTQPRPQLQLQPQPDTSTLDAFTFDDPDLEAQVNSLPVDIRGVVAQLIRYYETKLENGEKINPDIKFTPERLQEFIDTAKADIEPYYQEVMEQNKQDIELSLGRLSEDYKREVGRAEEPFKENLSKQAESEAQAGLTYGSERGVRERQAVQSQQRNLDDVFRGVERGVQDTIRTGERTLGSSFFSGLRTPQFSPFIVNTQGFEQGIPRTLGQQQGGLLGSIPKQREVDIRTRASEIEDITRRNRILDLRPL